MDFSLDLERLVVVISVVLLAIGTALVVVIAMSYLFITRIRDSLADTALRDHNKKLLSKYVPALKLLMLKLTPHSGVELDNIIDDACSKGTISIRLEKGVIRINRKTFLIEPPTNDPASVIPIDTVLRELNTSGDSLGYWISATGSVNQFIQQTPLDFFQHITGVCYNHINENKTFLITIDKNGLLISKCTNNSAVLCTHRLKIVDNYPERVNLPTPLSTLVEVIKPEIRRWETNH